MISPPDLERRLQALAADIDWPPGTDIAGTLVLPPRRRAGWMTPRLRVALASVCVLLVAFTAVLVASPATRTAVARLLGFPGITVEVGTEPLPELTGMELGTPISLAEAEARTRLDLRTLPLPGERIWFDGDTGAVHIAYRYEGSRLALLTQLRGADEPVFRKQSPDVRPTQVNGRSALWVGGGGDHAVMRIRGDVVQGRPSLNALLWEAGGVTYRLELAAELSEVVRLAERLR